MVAHAGGVVLEVAEGRVELVFLDAFEGVVADGGLRCRRCRRSRGPPGGRRAIRPCGRRSMNSRERARSCRCSRAWNRSTIWVASGNLAVAMFQIQAAPSPRMVSWRTWSAPRRMPSAFTRSAEHGGGLEGGDVAGGVPVADRVAVVVELVLGEEDGELDLAGAGPAVLALAVPAGGLLRGHGDAGAVDDGVELVRQRGRRQRDQLAGGDQRGPVPDGGGLRGAAGLGGPLDPLDGQPDPGQVLQQPGGPRERPGGRGLVVHRGQARATWTRPATPSSASRGARPCPQAAQ